MPDAGSFSGRVVELDDHLSSARAALQEALIGLLQSQQPQSVMLSAATRAPSGRVAASAAACTLSAATVVSGTNGAASAAEAVPTCSPLSLSALIFLPVGSPPAEEIVELVSSRCASRAFTRSAT